MTKPDLIDNASWADDAFVRRSLPHRADDTHKWKVGGLLVIAGSPAYTGAAWLASRAAGRAGAGIVYLATPRSVIQTIAGNLPEVAHVVLPETDASGSLKIVTERLQPLIEKCKAVVVGPGLGQDETADILLRGLFGIGEHRSRAARQIGFGPRREDAAAQERSEGLLFSSELPILVDADGLNWLAEQENWHHQVPEWRLMLTPHIGEMSRLTGMSPDDILADQQGVARRWSQTWKQTVVLKGGYTVVAGRDGVMVADQASAALATAGSGDVFSGVIGALLAQGLTPVDAAGVAIAVGPRAASLCADRFGIPGVISTDLPDAIAATMAWMAPGNGEQGNET